MRCLKVLIVGIAFIHSVAFSKEMFSQSFNVGELTSGEAVLHNYNDYENGPFCELEVSAGDSTFTRDMFDGCGNLIVEGVSNSMMKVIVINYRGNREKIVYFDSKIEVLGIIEISRSLTDERLEVIENHFDEIPPLPNIDGDEKKLLDNFKRVNQ